MKESERGILLSTKLQKARRADVCTVISAGYGVPVFPGDVVATAYDHALRIGEYESDTFKADYDILFFGSMGDSADAVENTTLYAPFNPEWDDYCLMVKQETWVPLGRNILIEIPEAEEKYGSILIADSAKQDPLTGIVRGVGPDANFKELPDGSKIKVSDWEEGQEVLYYAKAAKRVTTEDGKRLRIVTSDHVYATVS